MQLFDNRYHAGQLLAEALLKYHAVPTGLILALPRGGVPVAFEAAKRLELPFDIFLVRKIGAPQQKELAIGAIADGGITLLNHELIHRLTLDLDEVQKIIVKERKELERRRLLYRQKKLLPEIQGKTIILVDDGLATGMSMKAAIHALRKLQPEYLIAAVPVAPLSTYQEFKKEVDEIICLYMPEPFYSIGSYYRDFSQTTDKEVVSLLQKQYPTVSITKR